MKRYLAFLCVLFVLFCIFSCENRVVEMEEIVYVSDRVAPPVITPIGGMFYDKQIIKLTSQTEGARIIYTIDGTNPTKENGLKYNGEFAVNAFAILKALAYKEDMIDSIITRSAYSFKVATPIYSQNERIITTDETFSYDAKINMSNSTQDSTMYYTIDGSTPTSASNMYTVPLTLSYPVTLKTVAYKYGWSYSETKSINFSFKVEDPSFSPNAGTYDSTFDVVLSPSIYGAKIYYTTDGSTPTDSSQLYTTPILVDKTTTVKAIAVKNGMNNSNITISEYKLKTLTPILSNGTGNYKIAPSVTMTSTVGSDIYYIIHDTTSDINLYTMPDTNSTKYTAPVVMNDKKTLIAVSYKAGFDRSNYIFASYTVDGALVVLSSPTSDKDSGSFESELIVTLSNPNSSGVIRYTLDGSIPTLQSGIMYENPIKITNSSRLNALCVEDNVGENKGKGTSSLLTRDYTITGTVATPKILVESGVYNSAVKLEIENYTNDSVVRYTINGDEPTKNDLAYNGPVSLVSGDKTLNIKVKAFRDGWTSSGVATVTVEFKLPNPSFNPQTGTFKKTENIVISQPVLGATTRYTIDGSDPSESNGILYNGLPILINTNITIKAISYKDGWSRSDITSASYTTE